MEAVDEHQIYPTLAFASEIGQNTQLVAAKEGLVRASNSSEAWEEEADAFTSRYASLRPVKYVDEILLLERVPASVQTLNYPGTKTPQEVTITAYQHRKPASPEYVAGLYERELSAAGIPCEQSTQGNMGFEFKHDRLRISIRQRRLLYTAPKRITLPPTPFPHPSLIGEFYRALIGTHSGGGFGGRLAVRKRGGGPRAINLIPALVVVCLKTYGAVGKPKDVHRLLNTYVLCASEKAALPEEGITTSEVAQLTRDVNKWKDRLQPDISTLRSPEP